MRLVPAYDIVSTVAYEESPRDMSFWIGDSYSVEGITPESFRIAAVEADIGVRIAMRQFDCMCQKFADSLKESSELLSDKGYIC